MVSCSASAVEAWIKPSMPIPVKKLRTQVGKVTWHTRFKGGLHSGAAGLPGPFRQSLTEVCTDLYQRALSHDAFSLFVQCPNGVHQVGEDRSKLIPMSTKKPVTNAPASVTIFLMFLSELNDPYLPDRLRYLRLPRSEIWSHK